MKESKKIAVLQKMVGRLQLDNQKLRSENIELQEQLDFEKRKQIGSNEKQTKLENELQNCITEYKNLIKDTELIKQKSIEELNKAKEIRKKYDKKLTTIINSIKNG